MPTVPAKECEKTLYCSAARRSASLGSREEYALRISKKENSQSHEPFAVTAEATPEMLLACACATQRRISLHCRATRANSAQR